jgi:hypothetical protein
MSAKEQVVMCSAAGVQQIKTVNYTMPGEAFKEPPRSKPGGVGAKEKTLFLLIDLLYLGVY